MDNFLDHVNHLYYGMSAGLTEPTRAFVQSQLPYGQRFDQELQNIRNERNQYRLNNPFVSSFLNTTGTMMGYIPLSIVGGPIAGGLYGATKGYNERGNISDATLSGVAGMLGTQTLPRIVPK